MIRGGKIYVSSRPAFSNDAKRILVCTGNLVSIFSTETGLLINFLEGHTDLVTAVIVTPALKAASKIWFYCWTASVDGTIRYWDYSVPELIKAIDVKFPIISMVIPSEVCHPSGTNLKLSKTIAYISIKVDKQPTDARRNLLGHIRKFNLTDSKLIRGITLAETNEPRDIEISPSGSFFGTYIRRKIIIWKVPAHDSDTATLKRIRLHHTKAITTIAFHPTQRIVAAGDETGRILIWRGFGNKTFCLDDCVERNESSEFDEEKPGVRGDDDADMCTTWHWHSAKVNLLTFSSDGTYLYSGGMEGVLVVWQLDTAKKKFLPRVGSPLLFFTRSSDFTLSSISCADNQIHLLKMPSLEISKSISGIKLPSPFPITNKHLCSKNSFDSNAGLVALRSGNYRVQLYSLFEDRGVHEVQVCERNHHPVDEVSVIVELAVLSPDGSLLITVDVRIPEDGIGGLVSLKFWAQRAHDTDFTLSSVVYEPHRDAGISAIAFHPTRYMAVTSSYGGDFKIWTCNNGVPKEDEISSIDGWSCLAVGSYKRRPMTAAAFSPDGSVLAVAAETVITLWDPEKNALVAITGDTQEVIVKLSFVGKTELAAMSWGKKPELSIWNLLKSSRSWSHLLHTEDVACDIDFSNFAALVLLPESVKQAKCSDLAFKGRDGAILVFHATSPIPIATWLVKKAKGGSIAFLKSEYRNHEGNRDEKQCEGLLAFVNGDHEYVLFNPHSKDVQEFTAPRKHTVGPNQEKGTFGYETIYGKLQENKVKNEAAPWAPKGTEIPWGSIFSGPSHSLPPLEKLCATFVESLLERRSSEMISDV